MPFEELETEATVTAMPTALIEYMRPKPRKGATKEYDRTKLKPRLHITIPTTICGRAKSDRFVLKLGSGTDKGKARICASNAAKSVKPHRFKHAMTFKFGFVPKLGDEIADKERVPVRAISSEEFEFDLPPWWKA